VVILIVLLLSLYPSLRVTVHNLERVSAALAVSAENFADVSDETAQNLAQTSVNLNEASANFKETAANFENNSLEDGLAETIIRLLDQAGQRNPR
jgi:methyl-accepting chemotaxis protein